MEYLVELRENLKNNCHQKSTRHTYHSVWQKFNKFVIQLDEMPETWEERASLYCTYLIVVDGLQSATIKSYVSAIKFKLKNDGYQWSDQLILFKSLVGACRLRNDQENNRLPIRNPLLTLIINQLNSLFTKEKADERVYLILLYRTIFLILYYGLLRIGEAAEGEHVVLARNVHFSRKNKRLLLLLYSSKTKTKGKPSSRNTH